MDIYISNISNTSIGGPVTFTKKLINSLGEKINIVEDIKDSEYALIIINDNIQKIKKAKKRNIQIIQRLDGVYTFATSFIKYPLLNYEMRYIYNKLSDKVVFQSKYSKLLCEKYLGRCKCKNKIIYNGVDQNHFNRNNDNVLGDQVNLITVSRFRKKFQLTPILNSFYFLYSCSWLIENLTSALWTDKSLFKIRVLNFLLALETFICWHDKTL